jgi:hypothetical protein
MPSGPSLKNFSGSLPSKYDTQNALNGTTVRSRQQAKQIVNRLRMKVKATTAGTAGTGTTTAAEILKTINVYKVSVGVGGQEVKDKVLEILNTNLLEAQRFSKARVDNVSRGTLPSQNDTCAGDSTYEATVDVLQNLLPGTYEAEAETIKASELAGYTTAPTTFTVEFAMMLVSEGIPIKESEYMSVKTVATVTALGVQKVREVMIKHASASQEANISAFSFDETLTTVGLEMIAEEGLLRTGSSSMTVIYKSTQNPADLAVAFSTSLTWVVASVR